MSAEEENQTEEMSGQMSFLEHLDELRRRLIKSVVIVFVAFIICFYFSPNIFNFLSVPINRALAEAQRSNLSVEGLTGEEKLINLNELKEGETGRYVFGKTAEFNKVAVTLGTSVDAIVATDKNGVKGLFSNEPIFTNQAVIPKGIRLPVDLTAPTYDEKKPDERLIVTTAMESFTLLVTVSLYSAIAFSVPLLLFQIWGFIAPALYNHERKYVTPFILLSSISFITGAAFAYYLLFPPAVSYLLGLGSDNFNLMLRATDYFDFIVLIMLAMGAVFQMPAITYVLARIGLVNARFLIRSWKMAVIVILIVAAVISPTADALNMMFFAAPMIVLYVISIFVAWFFGKKRTTEAV